MTKLLNSLLDKLRLDAWSVQARGMRGNELSMAVLTSSSYRYALTVRVNEEKQELTIQASDHLPESFIELKGLDYAVTEGTMDTQLRAVHRDGNRIAVAITAYAQATRGCTL